MSNNAVSFWAIIKGGCVSDTSDITCVGNTLSSPSGLDLAEWTVLGCGDCLVEVNLTQE